MRIVATLLLTCLLAGCGGFYQRRMAELDAEEAAERAEEAKLAAEKPEPPPPPRVAAVVSRYAPLMVAPTCEGKHAAGLQRVAVSGVRVQQACGLVTTDATAESFAKYASACQSEAGACLERYVAMYLARVSERYPYADAKWIDNHCTGYPDDCASLGQVELLHLNSHNKVVADAWRAQTQLVVAQTELEDARRRQAIARSVGNAFQAVGRAMQQPTTVNCTSSSYGSGVHTSCSGW
jgi:hypothetical protein